ncbi:MAG: hypothetical protein JSV33_05600 [bacterium]|nr:MAG: hypothetical protein JSV33_05600 [bacterium]
MTKGQRVLVIVLCVVIGIVVIASAALRIILTEDRLRDLVVPRVEKAIDATIVFDEIGVRFPFGFGIDIGKLRFEKSLPEEKQLTFSSDKVVVRASLVSLIRKRPEIQTVDVRGGRLSLQDDRKRVGFTLAGLGASLSIKPVRELLHISAETSADTVFITREKGRPVPLGGVDLRAEATSDMAFSTLDIEKAALEWNDVLRMDISGSITDLTGRRQFTLDIQSADTDCASLVAQALALPLDELVPSPEGGAKRMGLPVEIAGGTVAFTARVEGSGKSPAGMRIAGDASFKDIAIAHPAFKDAITVAGTVAFSNAGAETDNLSASFGRSTASIDFALSINEKRRLETVRFAADSEVELGDLLNRVGTGSMSAAGRLTAKVRGAGTPGTLAGLFPTAGKKVSPEGIATAWKAVSLSGSVGIEDASFAPAGSPLRVSSLEASAAIEGADIKTMDAAFTINGSPFECMASWKGVMPAMAELMQRTGGKEAVREDADLGFLLDSITNAPALSVNLKGRSFDARIFEQPEENGGPTPAQQRTDTRMKDPVAAFTRNPAALLILKNTAFTTKLDSVIAEKAILTDIRAEGRIRNGLMRVEPLALRYADGAGHGTVDVNLRDPERVETTVDIVFDGIQAGKALGGMRIGVGELLEGEFDFKTKGMLLNGPDLNPLNTLSASGSAISYNGRVNFRRFIAPLTALTGFDLAGYEAFDFHDWSGSFTVRGGRLFTEDWAIKSKRGDWVIQGSFGFDGTLDYTASLLIPPNVQKGMKDLSKYRDLADLLRDTDGNLIIDFGLGGSVKSPKVSFDLERAKRRAGEKMIDGVKKKIQDLLKKK